MQQIFLPLLRHPHSLSAKKSSHDDFPAGGLVAPPEYEEEKAVVAVVEELKGIK